METAEKILERAKILNRLAIVVCCRCKVVPAQVQVPNVEEVVSRGVVGEHFFVILQALVVVSEEESAPCNGA